MSQQFDHIPDFFETVTDELARVVRRNTIILSIVAIVAGVCLLAWPGHTLAVVAVILGLYFIVVPHQRHIGWMEGTPDPAQHTSADRRYFRPSGTVHFRCVACSLYDDFCWDIMAH